MSGGNPTGTRGYMIGTVTSYSGTTLTMNIASTGGSGTQALWIISTLASTTITHSAPGVLLTLTEATSRSVQVGGIRFVTGTGTGDYAVFKYTSGGQPILVHDCYFESTSALDCIYSESNRGVIWNCSFAAFPFSMAQLAIHMKNCPTTSWTTASTMGSADTTGTENLYVEDCDFHAWLNCTDFDDSSRVVVRNCLMNNAGCGTHGADTSTYGVRHYEFYNNLFVFNAYNNGQTFNLNWWFFLRGGTGVIASNTLPAISSTDYGTKQGVNMIVMNLQRNAGPNPCWGAGSGLTGAQYPAPRQVGMGRVTGTAGNDSITYKGDSEPLYIWGNTSGYSVGTSDYGGTECSNPDSSADYIVAGRDYFNNGTAKPGWVAYTYPHPLRNSASTGNQPPVVIASANPTNGAPPLTVNFSSAGSSDPEGAPLTYSWTFGDGGTSTAANPTHTYVAGAYSARLSVSDGTNTTTSSAINIHVSAVNQPPVAVASVTTTNGEAPLTVTFSSAGSFDPEGATLTYNWTFGDGGTSTVANPAHTYTVTGLFDAKLTVSDGVNTNQSPAVPIAVRPVPPIGLSIISGP
jgi:PKD repeat protein